MLANGGGTTTATAREENIALARTTTNRYVIAIAIYVYLGIFLSLAERYIGHTTCLLFIGVFFFSPTCRDNDVENGWQWCQWLPKLWLVWFIYMSNFIYIPNSQEPNWKLIMRSLFFCKALIFWDHESLGVKLSLLGCKFFGAEHNKLGFL